MYATSGWCSPNTNLRGMDEATTQWMALKQSFDVDYIKYNKNVLELEKISVGLEKAGFPDVLIDSYFNKNDEFAMIIDSIGGNGTYNKIAGLMDIADGCGYVQDKEMIDVAKVELGELCDNFYNKCILRGG